MSDTAVKAPPTGKILSFPISKINEEKREVWGFATTEALDQQGEIVDYEASVRAFDKWTGTFEKVTNGGSLGNVREMHGPKSVGKVIAYQPDDAARGIWVGAKITKSSEGDDAWQKVKDRVLCGFSIGAPRAERRQEYHGSAKVNRVVDYDLAELSLVDNPACPESYFHSVKLASVTADGPAYAMELVKRFDADEKPTPSGVDLAPAPNILQKTVELNPETFVDASGDVWTRVNGRVSKREAKMDMIMEKSKIGPSPKPAGTPPGPSAEAKPDESKTPTPSGQTLGKDAVPTENKELGGDGANDGRNAGNAEQEKQIKGEGEAPNGQGAKAAGRKEPDGDEMKNAAATLSADDAKIAGSGFSHCAMCGGEMKSFGDNVAPYHKRCIDAKKAAAAGKNAAAGVIDDAGLVKAFGGMLNPIVEQMNKNFAALQQEIVKLKNSPAPGGPARTELPEGVKPVEKGASASGVQKGSESAALEKAMALVEDPIAKDAISRQLTKLGIKDAQNRAIMG